MRKIFVAAMALAIVGFVGCSKDEVSSEAGKDLKVNFSVADKAGWSNDSRAIKSGWEDGDQILIGFMGEVGGTNALLSPENNANTLKLTYNGTTWVVDDANMPTTGLKDGAQYSAVYYPGEVSVGGFNEHYGACAFDTYKGGELLSYSASYTFDGTSIDLGTIAMARDSQYDFQISVKGLTGDNWLMSICSDKSGGDENMTIIHYEKDNLFWPFPGYGNYANYSDASGIGYGGDVYFYFSKVNLTSEVLVFKLTNGTDTYYYTKTGVTSTTLEGGKAYYLPAITDSKWETE